MYRNHSNRWMSSTPAKMKSPRVTRARTIPHIRALDRNCSGSPKYPKMMRNANRLSMLRARSATYAVMYSMPCDSRSTRVDPSAMKTQTPTATATSVHMMVMMVASRMLTVCSFPASTTRSITSMMATTTVKIARAPTLLRSSRVVVRSMACCLGDFGGC